MLSNTFRRCILYFRGLFRGRVPTSQVCEEKKPLSDKIKEDVRKDTDTASNFVEPQKRLEDENGTKIGLKKSDLEVELQRSHQTIQSLTVQKDSMKEELENLKSKLLLAEEKVKLIESRYQEEHVKSAELEDKLQEVLSSGTIPISQHEIKVTALENELSESQEKLMKLTESFNKFWKMLQKNAQEKKEICEETLARKFPFLFDEQNSTNHLPSNATVVGYKCRLRLASYGARDLPDVLFTQGEIPGENITFKQFKSSFSENLRYLFLTTREDLGLAAVFQEVTEDSQVLPLWEGQLHCIIHSQ